MGRLRCDSFVESLTHSMAPELINSAKCSTKVDVYSFGCVVYEIISEQLCYTGMKFAGRLDVGVRRRLER